MPGEKRKSKKQNYFQKAKQSRKVQQGRVLQEGMRGFLVTCNNREREAVREAYNLFNEFADQLFGAEGRAEGGADSEEEEAEEEDIDAAFDKEKTELAAVVKKTGGGERRFQVVESGARNCVFIKTSLEDPEALVTTIIDTVLASGLARARFILRLLPILGTCRAQEAAIEALAREVLGPVFPPDSTATYSILFKTRNNGSLGRDDVIRAVGGVVRGLAAGTSVHLKAPAVSIVVEVVRAVACLGLARDYHGARRKYNLVELVRPEGEGKGEKEGKETLATIEKKAEESEDKSELPEEIKTDESEEKSEPKEDTEEAGET